MGLRPVEVEISISPGLPKIQFLGLPDTLIKESVLRIQTALKHCGYKMPKAKQILVQLKPNHLKKSSLGLDLAVACGILWESAQEKAPDVDSIALYGELSLKGDVFVPDDFQDLYEVPNVDRIMTGRNPPSQSFDLYSIDKLTDLKTPQFIAKTEILEELRRPQIPKIKITEAQARLLKIIAVGEHPSLFGGPPGSGKTTMAMLSSLLLKNPDLENFKMSQKISRRFGIPLYWRPIVSPHHTSTALAMIGGGNTPRPGEITRAHGGVLVMDEFLEFDTQVQEALREPMETGHITISRSGYVQIYPAQFLLLATTNLCPCGYLIPDRNFECRGRVRYCHSLLQKLSGPMMDRFHLLSLSHTWGKNGEVSVAQVKEDVQKIHEFQSKRKQTVANQFLIKEVLEKDLDVLDKKQFLPGDDTSYRRYLSLLKVARTIADCELSEKILAHHMEEARRYAVEPFQVLKNFTQNY